MNEIVNKFLLAEERLMWEMYSRQPRFIYSACGPFTEKKKKKKKKKKESTYGDSKDLPRRTAFDKILHDKAFNIAKIQNRMDMKGVLLRWFIIFLIRSPLVVLLKMKLCQTKN